MAVRDGVVCTRRELSLGATSLTLDVVEARGERDEDRWALHAEPDRIVVAVCDGAGGTGGGRLCAEALSQAAVRFVGDPARALESLDRALAPRGGESTVVLAELTLRGATVRVRGASVGDSQLWCAQAVGTWTALSDQQRRKPLAGSGRAHAVAFEGDAESMLLGTDGLFAYADAAQIGAVCALESDAFGPALAGLVRLPRGGFPDDVCALRLRCADDS